MISCPLYGILPPGLSSMSVKRATGMKSGTALVPWDKVGPEKRGLSLPMMLVGP